MKAEIDIQKEKRLNIICKPERSYIRYQEKRNKTGLIEERDGKSVNTGENGTFHI